eukprot:9115362-Lingulodinium_polyedra.AAC.1
MEEMNLVITNSFQRNPPSFVSGDGHWSATVDFICLPAGVMSGGRCSPGLVDAEAAKAPQLVDVARENDHKPV